MSQVKVDFHSHMFCIFLNENVTTEFRVLVEFARIIVTVSFISAVKYVF